MAEFVELTGEVLAAAGELARLAKYAASGIRDSDAWRRNRACLEAIAGRLRGHQRAVFGRGLETVMLRSGIAAARSALELETAVCALADFELRAAGDGTASSIIAHMAYLQCVAALGPLGCEAAPAGTLAAHRLCDAPGSAEMRGALRDPVTSDAVDVRILSEISRLHRQHALYHTLHKYDNAREISGESHKIKALADFWLEGGGPKPRIDVDFSDPRYSAVPCTDLNVPEAIPSIGFLFLEGAGAPPEITLLESRLGALAEDAGEFGRSLTRAMDAAWVRESALFAPERTAIAWTRLQVVLSNWRAANDSTLAARLLTMSREALSKIDFTPKAVRARIRDAGRELIAIAWTLDMAAQLCAVAGASLADNNWRYTQYSEFLEDLGAQAKIQVR